MQIIPAIDLKNNKCVRLTEGIDDTSVVFNDQPDKQAIYFQELGCKKIHIVDLDAAFGRPEININSIKKIRESISIPIQLGGGIRTFPDAKKYFELGIENLIIGSMSIKEPETVKSLCNSYKKKIYISLDVKANKVMVKGWKEESKLTIDEILEEYNQTEIKGYIITDIKNDGMLKGLDLEFIKKIVNKINQYKKFDKKIIIAGGLTNYDDLKKLKEIKRVDGVISGKSFYVGNIDLVKAQQILN